MASGAFARLVENWKFVPVRKPVIALAFLLAVFFATVTLGQHSPQDPGVRGGSVNSGQPLSSLSQTPGAPDFFANGLLRFQEIESVQGGTNNGLGPRFNSNQCSSCHSQPAVGGTSPSATVYPFVGPNPETLVYSLNGADNTLPSFITPNGPVREARFPFFLNGSGTSLSSTPDGGVHDLFVISGRSDAGTCAITQPNFAQNLALDNVIFRIPTPTFGAGLIENISEETIYANMQANARQKQSLGISGVPNRDGNDGMITRFGWKAQNKSLEIFAGEAYNVEMGVTNELFQNERASPDEALAGGLPANCKINPTPEDTTNFISTQYPAVPSDVVQFAMFMRLLAPPTPSTTSPGGAQSIANGNRLFNTTGCAMCHTPTLQTASSSFTPGLSQVNANLFSDLLVHHMGSNLADGVSQGGAGPDQFRSAPLWGLGQRIFLLHDGRTTDLLDAIKEHASSGSEANAVISNFKQLTPQQQQDLLNFLRSL
ncbi:MAG TPA: di-heme oxidoredictase family protein [Candidatus Acidoferrum sp.]|nr:di-heme oxidoredictase family protein [Candidatus Acidoferrum sp.]